MYSWQPINESKVLHTSVMKPNLTKICSANVYALFWYLSSQNWSKTRAAVSAWRFLIIRLLSSKVWTFYTVRWWELRKSHLSTLKRVSVMTTASVCKPTMRATLALLLWPSWSASSVCKPTTFVVTEMGLKLCKRSNSRNLKRHPEDKKVKSKIGQKLHLHTDFE